MGWMDCRAVSPGGGSGSQRLSWNRAWGRGSPGARGEGGQRTGSAPGAGRSRAARVVNSGAIKNPEIIHAAAEKYGDQCVVLSVDVKRVDGRFKVFAKGGRENTGLDALQWIKQGVSNGAGEIVVNSIDTDGVKQGFDIEMLKAVCEIVNVPVIASGGAGCKEDFVKLFNTVPGVSAGLAASIFHYGEVSVKDLKKTLNDNNITVRL